MSGPGSFIVLDQSRTIPNAIVREFCLVNQPYEEIKRYEQLEYNHMPSLLRLSIKICFFVAIKMLPYYIIERRSM
jgi:hypothetical protein